MISISGNPVSAIMFLSPEDLTPIIYLSIASIASWFISTLTSGGSSMILMPLIGFFLGVDAIPPVITVGAVFGNVERAVAYREMINWKVIAWEMPGAIFGSCLGAFTLSLIKPEFLTVLVSLFLIISAVNLLQKPKDNKDNSFSVQAWYFLPAGFVYSWLSGITGSIGPILTPLYLNYGLSKEELLATQATARGAIHLAKTISYAVFSILTFHHLWYGVVMGIAAFPGNWLGHHVLTRISQERFRQLVVIFVILSSMLILWQQFEGFYISLASTMATS